VADEEEQTPGAGKVLLVFVDGLGLAAATRDNPLFEHPSPELERMLGGSLVDGTTPERCDVLLRPIDACLGVAGLPQSATGQTTLFTGVNAAEHLGRHVASFPGPRLRGLIEEHGLLAAARGAGLRVGFANAFSPSYFELLAARRRRASVTVLSARAAGLRFLDPEDLAERRALSWDLCRDLSAAVWDRPIERLDPGEAAADLLALTADHELMVYETFLPDLVGHRRIEMDPARVVARLDAFVGFLVAALPDDVTLVLTSDHGNFEEGAHRRHTRNPVPLLVAGARAATFAGVESLVGVAPGILRVLGVERRDAAQSAVSSEE